MRRDGVRVALVWLVLTVLGELVVPFLPFFPGEYAREAGIVDEAFLLLMRLAVPVFTLVVAIIVYSLFAFRARPDDSGDGPHEVGSRKVVGWWLAITTALALLVIVNPGVVGLAALGAEPEADLVVGVEARQWAWSMTYPNGVVKGDELVLPADRRVRFEVESVDVLHSFWIPAFRMKIDAVPGRTTTLLVTPTKTGSMEDDPALRVQCAELCGVAHGMMSIPVRVVEPAEFDRWLASEGT